MPNRRKASPVGKTASPVDGSVPLVDKTFLTVIKDLLRVSGSVLLVIRTILSVVKSLRTIDGGILSDRKTIPLIDKAPLPFGENLLLVGKTNGTVLNLIVH